MIKNNVAIILKEINAVLKNVDEYQVDLAIKEILKARSIVLCGAGRMGLMTRAFAMRLGHLGLKAYFLGDSTVPAIGKKDLLIVCSGSGETQTIYDMALIGKKCGSRILLVTSYIDHYKSRIAKIADTVVVINAPSKTKKIKGLVSIQPMTTLYEQCLLIFLDALVLLLMKKSGQSFEDMFCRHSKLE
ncbi:MAG: 6-phospho-3-hexuloisomerase [Candidatus Levybacteria bacterium]|nr:6-phospho-3-hexuloisomerase [Candidatus Levybacteria bacterium]